MRQRGDLCPGAPVLALGEKEAGCPGGVAQARAGPVGLGLIYDFWGDCGFLYLDLPWMVG
jgi:hypothetical protein